MARVSAVRIPNPTAKRFPNLMFAKLIMLILLSLRLIFSILLANPLIRCPAYPLAR